MHFTSHISRMAHKVAYVFVLSSLTVAHLQLKLENRPIIYTSPNFSFIKIHTAALKLFHVHKWRVQLIGNLQESKTLNVYIL